YKDEYEVARLLLDEDGRAGIAEVGGGRVRYHLHPPMLRERGMSRKVKLGSFTDPALRSIARGKRLRGTALDPFGRTEVRRIERSLPDEYRAALSAVLPSLDADRI